MRIVILMLVAAVPAVGCGTLWPSYRATASSPGSEVFACAVEKTKSLGYAPAALDKNDWRLAARRDIEDIPHRDYEEMKRVDELRVQVPKAARAGTELRVQAVTYSVRTTRRGPTQYDLAATDRVRADAEALVEACGGARGTAAG